MHRRGWVLVVLAAAVLPATGCGSDDSGGAAPTKARFIARADAICRDTKAAQLPLSRKVAALPDGTDLERVAALLEDSLAESRQGLAKLRALPAPEQDGRQLDAYLAAAQRVVEAHQALADAARAGDRSAGAKVARRTPALSDAAARTAAAYGLRDCTDVF